MQLGLRGRFGSPFLRLGALKAFMDGTLGSQTALLLDGGGVEITTRAQLTEIILRGAACGFPVAVHAIGDRANRNALDAFEATRDVWQPLGLRQRIEHAQLLAPEDVPRFAQLGVAASVQFSHATSDRDLADRNWAGMTERAYAYRTLADAGAPGDRGHGGGASRGSAAWLGGRPGGARREAGGAAGGSARRGRGLVPRYS